MEIFICVRNVFLLVQDYGQSQTNHQRNGEEKTNCIWLNHWLRTLCDGRVSEREQKMKRIEQKTQTCLDCKLIATIVHDSDHMNRINCEWVSDWASNRMKTKTKTKANTTKAQKVHVHNILNALYFSKLAFAYLFWFVCMCTVLL